MPYIEDGTVIIIGATTDQDIIDTLSLNEYHIEELSGEDSKWLCFSAEAGKSYEIYWDDSYSGSGTYSLDIKVSGYRENKTTSFFINDDSGYLTPTVITSIATELIYLKIEPYFSGFSGTFAIKIVDL